ncbi:MAG: hypothetical protein GX442_16640, partial [Candidatus Riflebacteria bacterium]|nr:hypothetical protein [Candidatus Riflebacteria bacterium]
MTGFLQYLAGAALVVMRESVRAFLVLMAIGFGFLGLEELGIAWRESQPRPIAGPAFWKGLGAERWVRLQDCLLVPSLATGTGNQDEMVIPVVESPERVSEPTRVFLLARGGELVDHCRALAADPVRHLAAIRAVRPAERPPAAGHPAVGGAGVGGNPAPGGRPGPATGGPAVPAETAAGGSGPGPATEGGAMAPAAEMPSGGRSPGPAAAGAVGPASGASPGSRAEAFPQEFTASAGDQAGGFAEKKAVAERASEIPSSRQTSSAGPVAGGLGSRPAALAEMGPEASSSRAAPTGSQTVAGFGTGPDVPGEPVFLVRTVEGFRLPSRQVRDSPIGETLQQAFVPASVPEVIVVGRRPSLVGALVLVLGPLAVVLAANVLTFWRPVNGFPLGCLLWLV